MPRIVRTAVFLQQCFASHRTSLFVDRSRSARSLVLLCRACRISHHLLLQASGGLSNHDSTSSVEPLLQCLAEHPLAVGVREVDCLQDRLALQCRACHSRYALEMAACETHVS